MVLNDRRFGNFNRSYVYSVELHGGGFDLTGSTPFAVPGILFGTGRGILIALTATTVSAVISLLIVRTLLRDWVEPRLTHPAVESINRRLEERGWLAILSLRMIAAVPFSIMNYADRKSVV